MRICIYAASSDRTDPAYREAARRLGELLADARCTIVYGGGSTGSMGAVADGALLHGGEVLGVLPKFMADREWGHPGLTRLELVEDMRERKHRLLTDSDAVIALPGGCGTLEELFEAITLKQLGLYPNPIVLLNTLDYWTPWQAFMRGVIAQGFMRPGDGEIWRLVDTPGDALKLLAPLPPGEGLG